MQKFSVDISSRGAPMVLYAAQGDTKSRFFSVAMFDSGVAYSLPIGAYVTVRFGAPGMPAGWYDTVQEPGGGSHPAVSVDGNVITAELAEQAVSVPGKNGVWLLVNAADGYQLASWGFDLFVEAVHGLDAPEATVYYNALAEQVSQTLANAQAASESASQAQQYAESINTSQFATATQGAKADTAVQSVNGRAGTAITLTPTIIGAATAAQGELADSAVQSANGQRGTTVTLTPATIGAANASDVLTLEEIQASTDLSGKIASASALKNLKSSLGVLDVTSFNVDSNSSIDISVDYKSCYLLIGIHRFAGTWCRALNQIQDKQVVINTWSFGNLGESYFNVVSKDHQTCTLAVGGVGGHVSCFLIRLGKVI